MNSGAWGEHGGLDEAAAVRWHWHTRSARRSRVDTHNARCSLCHPEEDDQQNTQYGLQKVDTLAVDRHRGRTLPTAHRGILSDEHAIGTISAAIRDYAGSAARGQCRRQCQRWQSARETRTRAMQLTAPQRTSPRSCAQACSACSKVFQPLHQRLKEVRSSDANSYHLNNAANDRRRWSRRRRERHIHPFSFVRSKQH